MAKVFLVQGVSGNALEEGLISEGKYLKFFSGGRYLGENPIPYSPDMLREVDILSILNVNNTLELAYVLNNTFKKSVIRLDINTIIKGISKLKEGNLFVGRREDVVDGLKYTQYIYAYKKGIVTEGSLLEVLNVKG